MSTLTHNERGRFHDLCIVVDEGLQSFVTVGNALRAISEEKLYRDEYSTFNEFVQDRFEIKCNYAHKLIASSEVVAELSSGCDIIPFTERQTRPLVAIKDPDVRRAIWELTVKETIDKCLRLTAKSVESVASRLLNKQVDGMCTTGTHRESASTEIVDAAPSQLITKECRPTVPPSKLAPAMPSSGHSSPGPRAQTNPDDQTDPEEGDSDTELCRKACNLLIKHVIPRIGENALVIDRFMRANGLGTIDTKRLNDLQAEIFKLVDQARQTLSK